MLEFSIFDNVDDHALSYAFACIAIPTIIVLSILIPIHYFKYREGVTIESRYFSELYEGTKDNSVSKLFTFSFIVRRFVSAFVLVAMRDVNIWAR